MTATQLSQHVGLKLDPCSSALWGLEEYGLVRCLSPKARRSRVYGCTQKGIHLRTDLAQTLGEKIVAYFEPNIDWEKYAFVCYNQRSTTIKVIDRPLQPSGIKRRALREYPEVPMSANNVRDNIPSLKKMGIIQSISIRKYVHPRYCLTKLGEQIKDLLMKVDFHGSAKQVKVQ